MHLSGATTAGAPLGGGFAFAWEEHYARISTTSGGICNASGETSR